jgi:type I restriction enzyme S subunit
MSSKSKTTATKEEAAPALVPKLRFPEFSDPWAHGPLSKVLKEHKLKNTKGRDVFSVSMEYGIVNQIELLGRSYAAADTAHYTIGRRYDVVYTKSPLKAFPFGVVKQCKFDGEVALSPLYGVFTPPNPHVGLIIEAYFESPNRSKDFLSPLCQKGAKNTLQITNTTFLSGRLPLPTQPAEQQKIAECLSAVDELMAAQARKVDALKTHKKGLLQKLFPPAKDSGSKNLEERSEKISESFSIQNSNFSIPPLRFPEFQNAGEWEVKTLGKAAENLDNRRVPITSSDRKAGDVPYYGASGIVDYVEGFIFDEDLLCVSEDGANLVARTYPIAFPISGKTWVNNHAHVLRFENACTQKFVEVYLNSIKLDDFITGMAQPKLNKAMLDRIPIPHTSVPEQQMIADCLSSLDALITAETQKHEALKTHKKGLMQQLFPSTEANEG